MVYKWLEKTDDSSSFKLVPKKFLKNRESSQNLEKICKNLSFAFWKKVFSKRFVFFYWITMDKLEFTD